MKINYFQQGGQYRMTPEEIQKQASINMMGEAGFNRMNQLADEVYANFIKNHPIENNLKPIKREPQINPVNDDIIAQVIRGKFGNGQARIDALTAAGYNPKEVQAAVNAKLRSVAVAPKQETTPAQPAVETPVAVNPAPVQQPATPAWASPVVAPAPIRNQAIIQQNTAKLTPEQEKYTALGRKYGNPEKMQNTINALGKIGTFFSNAVANNRQYRENLPNREVDLNKQTPRYVLPGIMQYRKEGGSINYFQQGGQMQQDPVGQVIQGLLQDPQGTMQALSQMQGQQGGKEQVNAILQEIVKRAKGGDQQAVQAVQVLQQAMQGEQTQPATQQTPMAKDGSKLNYFRKLKGKCPEGEEMIYMKNGGCMCQKKKDGGEAKIDKKQFFGKDKKVAKNQEGGKANEKKPNYVVTYSTENKNGSAEGYKYDTGFGRFRTYTKNGKFQFNMNNGKIDTISGISDKGFQTIPLNDSIKAIALKDFNKFNIQSQPQDTIRQLPVDFAFKTGGKIKEKEQFFKKEQKKPLEKCGGKMKAKKK